MTKTIIELAYTTDSNGDLIIAGNDEQAYQNIKDHLVAIEHNMNNGVSSTLYRVDDDATDSQIQAIVGSHSSHTNHGINEGIKRGLEIQPGTPTSTEVDNLSSNISNTVGSNLLSDTPKNTPASHVWNDLPGDNVGGSPPSWAGGPSGEPGAGNHGATTGVNGPPSSKSFTDVMKNDMPTIGEGKWLCTHPEHSSPEKNDIGSQCSLGHSDEVDQNEYACPHRQPFDPTSFL